MPCLLQTYASATPTLDCRFSSTPGRDSGLEAAESHAAVVAEPEVRLGAIGAFLAKVG